MHFQGQVDLKTKAIADGEDSYEQLSADITKFDSDSKVSPVTKWETNRQIWRIAWPTWPKTFMNRNIGELEICASSKFQLRTTPGVQKHVKNRKL